MRGCVGEQETADAAARMNFRMSSSTLNIPPTSRDVAVNGGIEILAVNDLEDDTFATPAILDNKLYLRTRGMLYCFSDNRSLP